MLYYKVKIDILLS